MEIEEEWACLEMATVGRRRREGWLGQGGRGGTERIAPDLVKKSGSFLYLGYSCNVQSLVMGCREILF
jgi:hypothetical protein